MAEEKIKVLMEGLLIFEMTAVSLAYAIRASAWSQRMSRKIERVRRWAEAEKEGVKGFVCPDGDTEIGEREQ